MAIYHCSTKPISRSKGRSAIAAAAYRSGEKIVDQRTGQLHDYTRRSGVMESYTLLPSGESCDRSELWNAAESAEKRKDARTAREWVIAIPEELATDNEKIREFITGSPDYELVNDFAKHLSTTYKAAVDVAIHAPDKKGDQRNYHAHILVTTREAKLENGKVVLGEKTSIELSDKKRGELKLSKAKNEVKRVREVWATLANKKLEQEKKKARIDHRSLKDQGINRIPTVHLGPTASAIERKGKQSERGNQNRAIKNQTRELKELDTKIVDLEDRRERLQRLAMIKDSDPTATERTREMSDNSNQTEVNGEEKEQPIAHAASEKVDQLSREVIGKTYTELLAQAQKNIEEHFQQLETEKEKTEKAWRTHCKTEPESPTGLLAGFKRKAFQAEHNAWSKQEQSLRHLKRGANREWNHRHSDYNAHRMAREALKTYYPDMYAERERLEKIDTQRRIEERRQKQLERDKERKVEWRGLSNDRGGLEI